MQVNRLADILGARQAGLQAVLYDPQSVFEAPDCPVINRLGDLPALARQA